MNLKKAILYFALIVLLFVVFMLLVRPAFAQDITLQWDSGSEPDLAGYVIYESEMKAGSTTEWIQVGEVGKDTTEYLAAGREDFKAYAYQVTAKDADGHESFVSNVAYTQNMPLPPANLRIKVEVEITP